MSKRRWSNLVAVKILISRQDYMAGVFMRDAYAANFD
jgi:hypothetical protein